MGRSPRRGRLCEAVSIRVGLASVAAATVFGTMLAFALARHRF